IQSIDEAMQEPTKDETLLYAGAFYWMTRNALTNARVSVGLAAAASIFWIGTYLLGGTFRLRLVMVGVIALMVLAVVSGVGFAKWVSAGVLLPSYDPESGRIQKLADPAAAAICFVVLVASLLLISIQIVLVFRLRRHRLRQ